MLLPRSGWRTFITGALIALVIGAFLSIPLPVHASTAQSSELFQAELETLARINVERRKAGIGPLRWNRELTASSRWFARDAVENQGQNYCGHKDSLGRTPGQRMQFFGYSHLGAWAENAVCGYATPAYTVQAWMDSAGHRVNLLNPDLHEAAVGYYQNAAGLGYIVLDLANDADYAPVVINDEAVNTTSPQVSLYIYDHTGEEKWLHPGPTTEVMIANSPDFAGATWQPYARELAWSLTPGTGWRTVYVKTRDRLERTSIVQDTIYLGDAAPAGELTTDYASAVEKGFTLDAVDAHVYTGIQFSLDWLADDSLQGLKVAAGSASQVADSAATGKAAYLLKGGSEPTTLMAWTDGFPRALPAVAYFRLKIANNGSAQEAVKVTINDCTTDVATLALRGTDFTAAGVFQEFALPFTLSNNGAKLITIYIQRSGPADVYWDTVSLYTGPTSIVSPYAFQAPGDYFRSTGVQVRMTASDGSFSVPVEVNPITHAISGTPSPAAPQLHVTPNALYLAADNPQAPTASGQAMLVCTGCGDITWQITSDASWLTAAMDGDVLQVAANPAGLDYGIYYGTVTASVPDLPDLPAQKISVTLLLGERAKLLNQPLFLPTVRR